MLEGDALGAVFHDDADEVDDGVAAGDAGVEGFGVEQIAFNGADRAAVIVERFTAFEGGDVEIAANRVLR